MRRIPTRPTALLSCFPDSWAGRIEVAEDSDANLMTIYQSASRQADEPHGRSAGKSVRVYSVRL